MKAQGGIMGLFRNEEAALHYRLLLINGHMNPRWTRA
jgi:hypothetical protein